MPFGNVNVSYTPCRSVAQLKYAANYMLGRNRDQLKNGVVKTEPNLYMALGCNRENFANNVLVTRKLNGQKSKKMLSSRIRCLSRFTPMIMWTT